MFDAIFLFAGLALLAFLCTLYLCAKDRLQSSSKDDDDPTHIS
jgi:hypothetical protein